MSEPRNESSAPVQPWKNPSYPARIHVGEKTQWRELLGQWQEKVAAALSTLGPQPSAQRLRLATQMRGACDQLASSVRRLPTEVGDLYHEDRHRLEQALAALERVHAAWSASS